MNGDHNPPSASSGASANAFAPLTLNRPSPFPATTTTTKNMAVPAFLPPAQPYRTPGAYSTPLPAANSFDRDAKKPLGTPFSATPPTPLTSALIRNLPMNTSEESLRLMLVFSKDLVDVEIMPIEQSDDDGFRSAILTFKSPAGAHEVRNMLDGKSNISNDAELIIEILGSTSPSAMSTRYSNDTILPTGASSTASAVTSAPSSRQTSRFNGTFQSLENITPPMNALYEYGELAAHDSSASYQNIFGPQSPIGNHLANGAQVTSKSLIDSAEDDDETSELLNDPIGFAAAENGMQRRQTAPQLPMSRMASLSLNTTPTPGPYYGHPGMSGLSGLPNTMSPTAMAVSGPGLGYNQQPPYRPNNFPPANPADQNPPCNTLYVGNLPLDTSEEELKAMFSKQRGYKRLCFRTKQNGPMCFVEFEDVTFATKALHDLYGQPLHNSVKGGIRLSFSKNPLGVRSGQSSGQNGGGSMSGMNGMLPSSANGFTTANGPPPGLSAPPGLGMNRGGYTASSGLSNGNGAGAGANNIYASPTASNAPSNPWGGMYNGQGPVMTSNNSSFPPYMMGR